MAKIIVSACLLGCCCRYKGDSCRNEAVLRLAENNEIIPVCPEQMGGLTTPRLPSERVGDRVMMASGNDVTEQYTRGAEMALYLAKTLKADFAVLKAKSPSCGRGLIYDGTFTGNKIPGDGTTAELFLANGIPVYNEDELDRIP